MTSVESKAKEMRNLHGEAKSRPISLLLLPALWLQRTEKKETRMEKKETIALISLWRQRMEKKETLMEVEAHLVKLAALFDLKNT
ncbi:hypothetical protein AMTR_s00023p00234730 [Amborella trichopoda]|uniref:Uncharacterized protein n=1 Tax=Amborella trichopoda TaxID=13333 RepID=W1NKL5_AMBTC|nr:hypothetical protein AMTR_s00023p00234730 [Amborella trichopoda]